MTNDGEVEFNKICTGSVAAVETCHENVTPLAGMQPTVAGVMVIPDLAAKFELTVRCQKTRRKLVLRKIVGMMACMERHVSHEDSWNFLMTSSTYRETM